MTIEEQIKEVKREIRLRHACYPKWVQSGRMKPEQAEHGIAAMEAVLETLVSVAEFQEKQGSLFT